MRLDIDDSSHDCVCCHTGMSYRYYFPSTFDIWHWTGTLCYEFDKYMGQYRWAVQLFRFLLENNRLVWRWGGSCCAHQVLQLVSASVLTLYLFDPSFCVATYLEQYPIKVTWMAARLVLPIMTLRMNMKPSEDNAPKSVPALPANVHVHMSYSSCTTLIDFFLFSCRLITFFIVSKYCAKHCKRRRDW